MSHSRTHRFIDRLVHWRWLLLALAAVLALLAWWPSRNVTFDRSIENMFSPRDPVMRPFRHFKEIFGSQEVLLAVYEDPMLLSPDGLRRLDSVSQRLRQIKGVRDVLSLSEISKLVGNIEKIAHPLAKSADQPAILNDQSQLAHAYRELFEGYTHSRDGRIAALACMIEPQKVQDAADPERQIVDNVRKVLAALPDGLAPGMVAGEPVMVVDGFRLVETDGQRLGLWSTLLLSITLAICFRSLRWLLAPLAVVQFAVLLTRATLSLLGLQLTLVSSMLTALVTVVGVATVTHLIVGFYEQRNEGKSSRESLVNAATLLAWPILGAIVTDMIGFGSLWWSSVGPVYDFGTMMVVGSLLVIPATILIVPAVALGGELWLSNWWRRQSATAVTIYASILFCVVLEAGREFGFRRLWVEYLTPLQHQPLYIWGVGIFVLALVVISLRGQEKSLQNSLSFIVETVSARPRMVLAVSVLVAIFAIIGSMKLTVETDFTKNFRDESELVRSYNLIESRLGGGGVWDVLIPAPAVLDQAYLDRVLKLEERLRAIPEPGERDSNEPVQGALTKVISLADAVAAAQGEPLLEALSPEQRLLGMSLAMPNFTAALRGKDEQGRSWLRIMLRSPERLPAEWKQQTLDEVRAAVADAFPGDGDEPAGEVTGYHVLMISLVDSLLRDQWMMFLLSCIGIAAVVFVAFRSPTLALLSLIPNVLPVLLVTGAMGWLGVRVNMGAAMIAAVSMGLSVDSSIHYITAFRRAIRQGRTVPQALDDVQQSVGRAMFLSTIAILVGFGVLCFSDFIPTIYFGALAGLTMLGGLAGNLVVLPLLLLWTTRDGKSDGRCEMSDGSRAEVGGRR